MKIGYARTSTLDQIAGFEAQRRDLEAAGCNRDRIFAEQISSVADRPQLAAALDYLRDDDVLVATKIDRLARSVPDLLRIVEIAKARGARVEILNLGNLDPSSVNGKLILTVLGAIAAFEREMMLERQREGIAAAKAAGKYKGRKPKARMQIEQVRQLADEGVSKVEIARRLGMHRASVHRLLQESPDAAPHEQT
jgi:DNA invertase Pin-like site-specific DNA recombinase